MTAVLRGIVACAFALSVAFVALPSAAGERDLYIEYSGGASFVPNQDLKGADKSGSDLSGELESNVGFHFGAAIGKRFTEHLRADLQLTYRQNEVTNMSLRKEADKSQGHIGMLAIMANGYVDWDFGIGVIPYLGAGIGWGSVEIDAKNQGVLRSKIEGRDSVFAWSIMAGGTYPINEYLDLSLGYRYIATTDPDINTGLSEPNPDPPPPADPDDPNPPTSLIGSSRRLEAEFDSHEIVLSLRFNF